MKMRIDVGLGLKRADWVGIAVLALLLAIWEIVSRSSNSVAFFLSRPTQVWFALVEMMRDEGLLVDIGVTAAEALIGTLIGTILGSALGLGLWMSRQAAGVAAPFIFVVGNFPIFALAPAAIVWFGIGMAMKILLATFATLFISLSLAYQGARSARALYGSAFDGFMASRWDTYRKIIVPGALDSVFSSIRVSISLGILGAFVGEFVASDKGLGRAIIRASGLYQIDRVLAASLCIVILASLFDQMALGLQRERVALSRAFGIPRKVRIRNDALMH